MQNLTVMQLLPALEAGGVERGTLEIAQALVEAGHESLVVSAGGRLVEGLTAGGSRHFEMALGQKSLRVLGCIGRLRKLIRECRPHIVHARSRLPAWVAWRALRPLRKRPALVTTLHGLNSISRYSSIMTRGDRVIAVSETCRDYWLSNYPALDPNRVTVIHRGIDPAEFPHGHQPSPAWRERFLADQSIAPGRRLLALPGRITRLKAHATFLRLIKRLADQGVDCHGLIIGGRDTKRLAYAAEMKALADELEIQERIAWTGHRSDIREVLAIADLVLSLSVKPESFGRTVVEALALGRPVVGWKHGGVGEILERVYPGGAVVPGEFEALVERCVSVLDSPPPVPAQQPFLKASMQAETLALYREMID